MNDAEIKEAIKILGDNPRIQLLSDFADKEYCGKALNTLINLAQLYLSTAGKMPEEKTGKDETFAILYQQHLSLAITVYNQARQECILAFMSNKTKGNYKCTRKYTHQ